MQDSYIVFWLTRGIPKLSNEKVMLGLQVEWGVAK